MLIQNELSVKILRLGDERWSRSAVVIAASSPLLIVCVSSLDLTAMYVVVCVAGFTTAAPRIGFPGICDPFV